ncbi:MAG: HK97 gp10 family phage protein [Clostridiales bacterium]|nr:HK97 gp10 family phage protein [Clostridiales bacterium]
MSGISPDALAKTIESTLQDYVDVTEEACIKGVREVANRCVSELHSAHPSGSGKYGSWDEYNASWVKTRKTSKKGVYSEEVHNQKHYQLAHLLENGHALRGGGRTRAFPHIAPVAERAEETLLETIKKHIK